MVFSALAFRLPDPLDGPSHRDCRLAGVGVDASDCNGRDVNPKLVVLIGEMGTDLRPGKTRLAWPAARETRDHPPCKNRRAESRGKTGPTAQLHPCAARGAQPLKSSRRDNAHGVAVDTVRARSLLQADGVEHGPRAVAQER